jgi:hypothetical protein
MKTGFASHVPEDVLEEYAMGMLPDQGCVPVEEHLLLCLVCQTRLDAADEYIRTVKAATSLLPCSRLRFGERAPAAKVRAVAGVR